MRHAVGDDEGLCPPSREEPLVVRLREERPLVELRDQLETGLTPEQKEKLEEAAKWCGEALDRHTRVAGSTGLAVARIKEEMAEVLV